MKNCIAQLYWMIKGKYGCGWTFDEQTPSQITFLSKDKSKCMYIYLQQGTYGIAYLVNGKWRYSGPFGGDHATGKRWP